jgi:hypothetical protein
MDKIDLRYQRGKIYTVRCYDDDKLIYVGSTIQPLSARIAQHRSDTTTSLYKYVNGNWNNWYIELYEEYPCDNKQLLEKREGEVTRLIGNINKRIECRTDKEYRDDNKEKIAEIKKEWYENNKEKVLKYVKEWYENNKEKVLKYNKQYRDDNKEQIADKQKQYRNDNKEKIAEKKKEKVICDNCGAKVRKDGINTHKKTQKCKLNNK